MRNNKDDDTLDFDDVIYESNNRNRASSPKQKQVNTRSTKRKTINRLDKSQFKLFYGITVLVGLIVCIVVFAIVFNFVYNGSSNNAIVANNPPSGTDIIQNDQTEINSNEKQSIKAVVTRLNYNNNIVAISDVSDKTQYSLVVDGNTVLKNKSGQSMSVAEIKVGDVVDIVFEVNSKSLSSLKISTDAWENRLVQNVNVMPENKTISFSNSTFVYDEDVIVTYNGEAMSIESISYIDFVTIRGIGNKVLFIDVNRSHGAIQVINQNNIVNGILEINTDIYMTLDDADVIEVLEGPNRVVVRGDNIEPFIRQINIARHETFILDLSESQLRTGILSINANPKELTIMIDGVETLLDEPILLEYGEYTVRAERLGYESWEGKVIIDRQNVSIEINLTEIQLRGNLILTSQPTEAQVYINNRYMGLTPVEIPLEYGAHALSVRKQGYLQTDMDINIYSNQVRYNVILREDMLDS